MAEQAAIQVGNRKIPIWVLAAGGLGAVGLFILTKIQGGGSNQQGDGSALAMSDYGQQLLAFQGQIGSQLGQFDAAIQQSIQQQTAQQNAFTTAWQQFQQQILNMLHQSQSGGGTNGGDTNIPQVGFTPPTGNPITLTPVGGGGVNPFSASGSSFTIPAAPTFSPISPSQTISPSSIFHFGGYSDYVSALTAAPTQSYSTGNYNLQVLLQGNEALVTKWRGEAGVFSGLPQYFIGAVRVPAAALGLNPQRTEATVPSYIINAF